MKLKKIANTRYYKDYEFKKNLDYFDRWQENYEEKSYVLKKKQKKEDIDIIGQFGVGFYSAFMVSKKIEVVSKKVGAEKAYIWVSCGADGYTIEETDKKEKEDKER